MLKLFGLVKAAFVCCFLMNSKMKLLELKRPNCAGIDEGSEKMFVAQPTEPVKNYSTYTPSLR